MEKLTVQQLFKAAMQQNASDLHLTVGAPPMLRINGEMVKVMTDPLTPEQTQRLCFSLLDENQRENFEKSRELDFSFSVKETRFRANLFWQRGNVSGVFRRLPGEIPQWQSLGLPRAFAALTNVRNGLILVTGPTGSGKSTTIASMVDKINTEQSGHIVTLEDPIEYLHTHKKCIVNQREIGMDSESFHIALKHLLRQDPDYVIVGELRDPESVDAALQVADTGHLVIASLHTNSAIQTINRLVDIFPSDQQNRIRTQLSMVLQGILSQQLVPMLSGGRTAAFELLLCPPSVRNLIRENKQHMLYSMMQMGQEKTGMRTMNQSLMALLVKRKIDLKVAFEVSDDPDELNQMLKKAGV